MPVCVNGHAVDAAQQFCPRCGEPVTAGVVDSCPVCGVAQTEQGQFCGACGASRASTPGLPLEFAESFRNWFSDLNKGPRSDSELFKFDARKQRYSSRWLDDARTAMTQVGYPVPDDQPEDRWILNWRLGWKPPPVLSTIRILDPRTNHPWVWTYDGVSVPLRIISSPQPWLLATRCRVGARALVKTTGVGKSRFGWVALSIPMSQIVDASINEDSITIASANGPTVFVSWSLSPTTLSTLNLAAGMLGQAPDAVIVAESRTNQRRDETLTFRDGMREFAKAMVRVGQSWGSRIDESWSLALVPDR